MKHLKLFKEHVEIPIEIGKIYFSKNNSMSRVKVLDKNDETQIAEIEFENKKTATTKYSDLTNT